MRTPLSSLAKGSIATLAAAATLALSATPAAARDYGSAGISVGDLIAGALILGAGRDNRGYDYGDRYDNRYGNNYGRGDSRAAVSQCVAVAQQQAGRYGRAQVTRITQVKDKDRGWEVKGQITVGGGNWNGNYGNRNDDRYGDRYDNRWGNRSGYSDSGNFKCRIDRGRVVDLDFSGLRGL
jgi:hypothetical protein